MTAKPSHNLFLLIQQIFFQAHLQLLQTNVSKIHTIRNEFHPEISRDKFKDGFNFLPFNFLRIFQLYLYNKTFLNSTDPPFSNQIKF